MTDTSASSAPSASSASAPSTPPHPSPFRRLLLTGAAGNLGQVLRQRLRPYAQVLRLSDIAKLAPATGAHEEVVACDLADKAAVHALVQDVDAIVHFGGISLEQPFEQILEANIKGVFHIYEAARRHGVKRVVFASSNHVSGFYRQDQPVNTLAARRPDGYYALSKSYGEDLAQLYFDRYGIETVSLRIGSSFPEPVNRRMLHSWLSYNDLTQLIEKSLFTPKVQHTVLYGMSANRDLWWDNQAAAHLGFVAQDSSEPFRAKVEAQPKDTADHPNTLYQGGMFTATGPFGD